MTLIKCPDCGHTVSSVASTCPQCGTQLSQFRFVQGEGGALTECRRCARKVLSGATTCPYCGISRPGWRPPYVVVALLVAFAVPALVLAALRERGPEATPAAPVARSEPQQTRAVAAAAAAPAPELAASTSSLDTVATETRWTLDWANVREGRGLETRVVRVLRPGSSVRVTDRQAGWWALYANGRVVGYVAGSLLSDQPPPEPRPEGPEGSRD
ncbi:MAG: zinc-ribbon domain-containing protein [Gemmatimonadetes bacterium]|nr:zinc-ribbon domain-containing protein [Gemmatimonadota bacterium]